MSQIILIEKRKALYDLIEINLSTHLGAEVIPRETSSEALSLLSILPSIDLIICHNATKEDETAKTIFNFLQEKKMEIDMIVLGKVSEELKMHVMEVADPKAWEKVISLAANALGFEQSDFIQKKMPDYVPIPIKYFLTINSCCCDVFLRIKKGPGEYQYMKRIRQGDNFSKKEVLRYQDQKLTHFYIPKEFRKNFTMAVSNELVNKLEKFEGRLSEQIELISSCFDVASKEILSMGFTQATIQLTEAIIGSIIDTIEANPGMSKLLQKVINSKTSYLYQSGHMKAIVSSEILNQLGDNNPKHHEALAYASFFHDITLVDHEELAKIESFEQLESYVLEDELYDLVFSHASKASKLIKEHETTPEETAEIILHHHGSINGKGFSTNNSKDFSHLSNIFIVASHFVCELIHFKTTGGTPKPIIEELYKTYPIPIMIKIIKALEEILKRKNI